MTKVAVHELDNKANKLTLQFAHEHNTPLHTQRIKIQSINQKRKKERADTRRHSADPLCRTVADEYRTAGESVAVAALIVARVAVGDVHFGTRHSGVRHLHLPRPGHVETGSVGDFGQRRTNDRP